MFGLDAALDKCNSEDDDEDDGKKDKDGGDDEDPSRSSFTSTSRERLLGVAASASPTHTDLLPPTLQDDVKEIFSNIKACVAEIESKFDRTDMDFVVHRVTAHIDECRRKVRASRNGTRCGPKCC